MTTYLEDALTRIIAMQTEVISGSTAVNHQFWWQESFPYWTNKVSVDEPGIFDGLENDQIIVTVEMRYIIGHLTEGFYGQPIAQAYADWPVIRKYFSERSGLQSANYARPLTGLDPEETQLQAGDMIAIFDNSGIGAKQVGCPFRLRLVFNEGISPKL